MSEPATQEEYEARHAENYRLSGHGIGNVHVHMPCPFCAAPEFLTYEILSMRDTLARGATCKECKRGMRAVFKSDDHSTGFELVQTAGADPAPWIPQMRRVPK
jgi:hypothetical protein